MATKGKLPSNYIYEEVKASNTMEILFISLENIAIFF